MRLMGSFSCSNNLLMASREATSASFSKRFISTQRESTSPFLRRWETARPNSSHCKRINLESWPAAAGGLGFFDLVILFVGGVVLVTESSRGQAHRWRVSL